MAKNCGGVYPLAAADIPADHPLRAIIAEKLPEAEKWVASILFYLYL